MGSIEVWYNNTKVVLLFSTATVHEDNGQPVPNLAVIGHRRISVIISDVVLYHDGYTVGSSYDAVTQ